MSIPVRSGDGSASPTTKFKEIRRRWVVTLEPMLRSGAGGRELTGAFTAYWDRFIKGHYLACLGERSDHCALFALGSYGRSEMVPHSDIDLMVVVPEGEDADLLGSVEQFIRRLWSVGVRLGHSVRTEKQALDLAIEEVQVASSLMDARLLAGDEALFPDARRRVRQTLIDADTGFLKRLVEGIKHRRKQFGDSTFLLEPQVKLGRGGLRDISAVEWSARLRFGTALLETLVDRGVILEDESQKIADARSYLLRTRFALHIHHDWKQDQLTYEAQPAVASMLGYGEQFVTDSITRFMQAYYRHARQAALLADVWLASWTEPVEAGSEASESIPVDAGEVARNPTVIFDLLAHSRQRGVRLDPRARRSIASAAAALPSTIAVDSHANQVIRDIVCGLDDEVGLIYLVTDAGVLSKVIPEWRHLVGHAQHDTYHVYTTDIHLLTTTVRMKELLRGDLVDRTPYLSGIAERAVERGDGDVLLVASLLHDIAKGLGGDHSIIGAGMASEVGRRLGFSAKERARLHRLVLDHLLMPKVSQRRDLSDRATMEAFTQAVTDTRLLDSLALLSFVDMDSVAPTHLNGWKQRLLEELHRGACDFIEQTSPAQDSNVANRLTVLRELLEREFAPSVVDALVESFPDRFVASTRLPQLVRCARLLSDVDGEPRIAFYDGPEGLFTEVIVFDPVSPGRMSDVAGVLDASGLDIRGARATGLVGGGTLDVFDVCTADAKHLALSTSRKRTLRKKLLEVLSGPASSDKVLKRRLAQSRLPPRARPDVRLSVDVDNDFDPGYTIIEVKAQDRPGLLANVTRFLAELDLLVDRSIITTEGDRAIDTFYVVDAREAKLDKESAESVREGLATRLESLQ